MKVSFDRPPMWEYIDTRFRVAGERVIFCFGDTIYNPMRISVTKELHAHEQIHSERQLAYQGGPASWWAAYIFSRDFMLAEEVPAHRAEYLAYCKRHRGAGAQRIMRIAIANKLCSKLYGNIVTHEQAMKAVTGEWVPSLIIADPMSGYTVKMSEVSDPTNFDVSGT